MNKKIPSAYEEHANAFMNKFDLKMTAVEAVPQTAPRWAKDGKHGIKWSITLSCPKVGHNRMQEIQFFFWSSVHDKEQWQKSNMHAYRQHKHPQPTAYDVLAGLYCYNMDSFQEFCDSFGYDSDSREAEATYKECKELNEKLESLLPSEAFSILAEIQ